MPVRYVPGVVYFPFYPREKGRSKSCTLIPVDMFQILIENYVCQFYDGAVRGSFLRFRHIVGRNVKRLRLQKGWTQQQLADRLQRHKQTIWAIEAGRQGINDRLMDDLAALFDVPYSELVRTDGLTDLEGVRSRRPQTSAHNPPAAPAPTPPPQPFREWIRMAAEEAAKAAVAETARRYRLQARSTEGGSRPEGEGEARAAELPDDVPTE